MPTQFLSLIVIGMRLAGSWQQISLAYVASNVDNYVFGVQNPTSSPIPISGNAGVDNASTPYKQWLIGASPTPNPAWDSRFDPISQGTVTQNWTMPGMTLPANKEVRVVSPWTHKTGFQKFGWKEDGSFTGLEARRDLDWWDPLGSYWTLSDYGTGGG